MTRSIGYDYASATKIDDVDTVIIDGVAYRRGNRARRLNMIDSQDVVRFEILSRGAAMEIFGIKAHRGLVYIETDRSPLLPNA